MAFSRYDFEKQVSYMDGIPVKISEKYKPPKKISLPGAILNKLNGETDIPEYAFTLEKSIVEKMSQWRSFRQSQKEVRKQRIEEERKAKTVEKSKTSSEDKLIPSRSSTSPPESEPYPILTPVPINESTHLITHNYSKPFNISDFEQDTSSPFDNMELKTINDLEELAHVLQPVVISEENKNIGKKDPPQRVNGYNTHFSCYNNWTSSTGQVPVGSTHPGWHQAGSQVPPTQSYVVQRVEAGGSQPAGGGSQRATPDFVQQLQLELRGKREAESKRESQSRQSDNGSPSSSLQPRGKSPSVQPPPESLPNPYQQLPPACQRLSTQLAEMGFPLSRVARAAHRFGDDEPKIVEFLVQVQRLEEMDYAPERAEKALVANEYKEKETIDYLNCLGQLLDLGFSEDKVEKALAESGLDRDKALDFLLAT